MCTGLEILGMVAGPALSAIGAGIQQRQIAANQRRMADARNQELRRTLAKNDELAERSRDIFDARRKATQQTEMEDAQKKAEEGRQVELEAAVEDTPAPAANVSLAGSAPTVVKSEIAKRMAEAVSGAREQARRLGTLGGYGDMWLGQGFENMQAGRDLAHNANFASGNMALLPYQQDIAEMRAYKPVSPIGGLLQGAGGLLSSYAGGGGALPRRSYTSPTYFR